MQFTLDVDDELGDAKDVLAYAYIALDDLTPLLEGIGSYLEGSTRQRFADKKAPNGASWANLLPNTQQQKGNNNILIDSGDLVSSITHYASSKSVTVGVSEPYGTYHQLGTNKMVARPFLGLSDDDKNEITTLINGYLERVL